MLVPSAEVPSFGAARAALTIDLFLPFGHRSTGPELGRYLQLLTENDDIQLRLHPVLGSEVAERGAELSLAAWSMVGADCARFLLQVAENPDWLADWPLSWAGHSPTPAHSLEASDAAMAICSSLPRPQAMASMRQRCGCSFASDVSAAWPCSCGVACGARFARLLRSG